MTLNIHYFRLSVDAIQHGFYDTDYYKILKKVRDKYKFYPQSLKKIGAVTY